MKRGIYVCSRIPDHFNFSDMKLGAMGIVLPGFFAGHVGSNRRRGQPFIGDQAVFHRMAEINKDTAFPSKLSAHCFRILVFECYVSWRSLALGTCIKHAGTGQFNFGSEPIARPKACCYEPPLVSALTLSTVKTPSSIFP